jgi:predicted DsbA family dithiol-disulfide isomerase
MSLTTMVTRLGWRQCMRVDVWADIVCPWCYLGSARFDAALRQFEHRDEVQVVYRSFELDPGRPAGDTQPVLDMLAAKYGMSPAQAAAAEGRVQGLAQAEGLDFTVEREFGNTRAAHRLLQYAQAHGDGRAMISALYGAYFGMGRPVFDEAGLIAVAAQAGLDAGQARAALADAQAQQQVEDDVAQARRLGVTGVPCYVLGGSRAVSGAQPTEVFLAALRAAWDDAAAPRASPA